MYLKNYDLEINPEFQNPENHNPELQSQIQWISTKNTEFGIWIFTTDTNVNHKREHKNIPNSGFVVNSRPKKCLEN